MPAEPAPPAVSVLRSYSIAADGERGIVIGPHGEMVWMCYPQWHDPPIFDALMGGPGFYAVTPVDTHVWGGHYEPGSLIWRSRWVTQKETIECREALALPAQTGGAVILRRVLARHGTARLRCTLKLSGKSAGARLRREGGLWTADWHGARVTWRAEVSGTPRLHPGGALVCEFTVPEGEQADLVLTVGATGELPGADVMWRETEDQWQRRTPSLTNVCGERDMRQACSVLSGLTSASGGMVAAITTSLPERSRQGTSYDYRFAWIRDQCYAGQAALRAGVGDLADSAVRFVAERLLADGPEIKPAYTVNGHAIPDQHHLALPGYPGGVDLVGNHVNRQFQLDAVADALMLLARASDADRLDVDGHRALETAAQVIAQRWTEPESGIWELEPRLWTHSRLMCVAALRAAAASAPTVAGEPAKWLELADAILAETSRTAVEPSGVLRRAVDDPRVDASLLMASVRGALAPDDPRLVATAQAIGGELVADGYIYRFQHDARPLGQAEGAFLLCGFMMSLHLQRSGDHLGAVRWFERTRAACGPSGLFAEEYDVLQRQLRGNFPQAFVHALLIETAVSLSR